MANRRPRFLLQVVGLALLFALGGLAGWEYGQLPSAAEMRQLATANPGETSLMRVRAGARGTKPLRQIWVDLGQLDPLLLMAVVASEDESFWLKRGTFIPDEALFELRLLLDNDTKSPGQVDPEELRKAAAEAIENKSSRGPSPITRQVVRNLWLARERGPLQKLKEDLLARRLEATLPRKRILTLYVNIAEWGDGAWGAEAAAREQFGASARRLPLWQSAVLAAMLSSPRELALAKKNRALVSRVDQVLRLLVRQGEISPAQARAALEEVRRRMSPWSWPWFSRGEKTGLLGASRAEKPERRVSSQPSLLAGLASLDADYPDADFLPAAGFDVGRSGQAIDLVVIHSTAGEFDTGLDWLRSSTAETSVHYLVDASGTRIAQMVREADTAWHAGNMEYNLRSVGIEHPARYTDAMYRASASIVRWLCNRYAIPKDRQHIVGHDEVPDPARPARTGGAAAHMDPGAGWDWDYFMALVQGTHPHARIVSGISGNVADAEPIAGALVALSSGATTRTDARGQFFLDAPPGTYTLRVEAAGRSPHEKPVVVPPETRLQVWIP